MTTEASITFTFRQRLVLAVVPRLVWALLWLVGRTWRFEIIAEEGATPLPFGEGAGAEIFCFWHQCVLPCTFYYRRTGRHHHRQPQLRWRADYAHPRALRLSHHARLQFARRARRPAGSQAGDRKRRSRHLHRRRPARTHLSHQDGAHQARAHHRRAHRRLSSSSPSAPGPCIPGIASWCPSRLRASWSVGRAGPPFLPILPRASSSRSAKN